MVNFANREALQAYRTDLDTEQAVGRKLISLCSGSGCGAYGTASVQQTLKEELGKNGLADEFEVRLTGCHGFCEKGPIMVIHPEGTFYCQVKPENVPDIVEKTLIKGELVKKLLFKDPKDKKIKYGKEEEIPFYKLQQRLILGANPHIDPTNIDHYLAVGGYRALEKALFDMKPADIIDEIKKSGLRGRGGGGFPAGIKWATCAKHKGDRYIICNADEGDPGAYMDRSILEGDPHSVIEGMLIAGVPSVPAKGYHLCRNEYPLAVETSPPPSGQARLSACWGPTSGQRIFRFQHQDLRGAGAFVCGESTALMASLEGKPGRPRAKYVHTVEKGFREGPTNLNNVETYANVPPSSTRAPPGTAAWARNTAREPRFSAWWVKIKSIPAWWKCPWGQPAPDRFDIGGGSSQEQKIQGGSDRRPFRRLHSGTVSGSAGGLHELAKVGSIMGSGGMIVMDQDTCMVDVARYFLDFPGGGILRPVQSLPRRHQADAEILDRICKGEGRRRYRTSRRTGQYGSEILPLRPGHLGTQPGADHHSLLQG
jgi:NADH-quinone oxidoreductase subunit F